MAVPVLPVIEAPPSQCVFQALEWLALAPAILLYLLAGASSLVIWRLLLVCISCCVQRKSKLSCRRMKTVVLAIARLLCVNAFPALFKMHKIHSDHHSRKMREFMVFLDRKVENNWVIISAFCSLACSIYSASAILFFYYFPVEESAECLEKDQHKRTLFCYSNSSSDPSSPVDCAQYNVTELHELHFQCYAIALPGLGIAVAAALGLAKVATVSITLYIKISTGTFKMTKNHSRKLKKCCCCCMPQWCLSRVCVNKFYIYSIFVILLLVSFISCGLIAQHYIMHSTFENVDPIIYLYTFACAFLPMLTAIPLLRITKVLEGHCTQGEYASCALDQRPPDPRDWDIDVESESSMTDGLQDDSVIAVQQAPDSDVESGSSTNAEQQDEMITKGPETEETQLVPMASTTVYGAIQM